MRKNRRVWLGRARIGVASAGALALAAGLAACGSSSSGGGSGSGGSSNAPIQLGTYLPLTGPLASTGLEMKTATVAAVKEANATGGVNGHKIDFTVLDNNYSGPQSVQVARQLVSQDHVVAMLGPCCTDQVAATLPYVANTSHVPVVLNTFPGLRSWFSPTPKYLFTTQTLNETQAGILGKLAAQHGAKNLAVVYANVPTILPMATEAIADAKQVDPSIKSEELAVTIGSTDWSPTVRTLLDDHADAVVFLSTITDLSNFLQAAKLQNLKAAMYGNATYADSTLFKLAGKDANGVTITALSYMPGDAGSQMATFRNAMQKYENTSAPTISQVAYYAGAMAFIDILKKIKGPITAASVTAALNSSTDINTGLMPTITFSPSNHVGTDEVRLLVVKNDQFVEDGGFIK
jgi:branched-chain amino acid transport system substrate-binding protein